MTIKTFIAGHTGLVGTALVKRFQQDTSREIITRTHKQLDLTSRRYVDEFFHYTKPDEVILAAARVGGIMANKLNPVAFLVDNLEIQTNVLLASSAVKVKKLLFMGSSCIYPKNAPLPIKEDALLTGALEPTNEAYAIAKIAGIKLVQALRQERGCPFISCMPTNLYGPHDNFDLTSAHVLPAMVHRFHKAKKENTEYVTLWGTGQPKREFLYVDDLADACHLLLTQYDSPEPINVGCGEDVAIWILASMIAKEIGYDGGVAWDHTKPDGTSRKILDISKLTAVGWKPKVGLEEGIHRTYEYFLSSKWSD